MSEYPDATTHEPWTRYRVEAALVAAFALVPDHPVYTTPSGFRVAGEPSAAAEPLGWGLRYLADDPRGRRVLFAYARSRATRASWRALCAEAGWPRSTAEATRIRAAETIAARLNKAPNHASPSFDRI